MSENNAHLGETYEQRLKRFNENHPIEVIETVINSMANHFVNELRAVFDNPPNRQTTLMFLGTHSIALTISHGIFGEDGLKGYRLFLQNFIDGKTPDTQFSEIAAEIHEWRNVLAHRWINVAGHSISYNFDMSEGWVRDGEFLILNPQVYLNQYLKAFGAGGRIYRYDQILTTEEEYEAAKQRFISKYEDKA
tara:strand:+ start:191 stop:766 length:576 start_codon:yes stop_codon:yes gene_type:complete